MLSNAASYYESLIKQGKYDNYIETYSGKRFTIDKPEFDIEDIAHALSNQCRFTGHTKKFYSVAEHSSLVMWIMQQFKWGDPFEGLMHDAHEAYCMDLASPWKVELPEYKAFEKRIEKPLRKWAKLPETITEECKRADWVALFVEAGQLIPSGARDWVCPDMSIWKDVAWIQTKLGKYHEIGDTPQAAKAAFLDNHWDYRGK